jgi:hypothetical protein
MTGRLKHAADLFHASLGTAPAVFGWRDRTVGAQVSADDGAARWLRVVCELDRWIGEFWSGNEAANDLSGVRRPRVVQVAEWSEGDTRCRGELMELIVDRPASAWMLIDSRPSVGQMWWRDLRRSVEAVTTAVTDRLSLDPALLTERAGEFGVEVDHDRVEWTTAHGDLHWANLTVPHLWILDWEAWGTAPAGYDAATLLCASLLHAPTARSVHALFAAVLDSYSGALSQLAAVARLRKLVPPGEHPELEPRLGQHIRSLLEGPHLAGQR